MDKEAHTKEIQMLNELIENVKNHKFHKGDKVRINIQDRGNNLPQWDGVVTEITIPYYYTINNKQAYVTEATPIPLTEDELSLVEKNLNGCKDTIEYLTNLLLKDKRRV